MSNVIQFPSSDQVEVTCLIKMHTGDLLYRFHRVSGARRQELFTLTEIDDVAGRARELMAQGRDVIWDDASRLMLFGDGGTPA